MHTTDVLRSFYRPLLKTLKRAARLQNYHVVQPGTVGPARSVPGHIVKPSYAITGKQSPIPMEPEIKRQEQIEGVHNACKLARYILDKTGKQLRVGMTTDEIDEIVHKETIAHQAYPSPLLYRGFPKSVCTSVNNVVCHGIPDDTVLQGGDMINIDVSVYYHGFHGDTSETYAIGEVDEGGQRLMEVGKECLYKGILACGPGAQFCDIGVATSEHAQINGMSVIPQIIGHGIGSYFHGPPDIFHIPYRTLETVKTMQPGMTFTIEPIICDGSPKFTTHSDGWTLLSEDNSRSSQFEHTVLITQTGVQILSKWHPTDFGEI